MSAFDTQCLYQVKEKRQQQKTDNNLLLVCPLLCFFLLFVVVCLSSVTWRRRKVSKTLVYFSLHTHTFFKFFSHMSTLPAVTLFFFETILKNQAKVLVILINFSWSWESWKEIIKAVLSNSEQFIIFVCLTVLICASFGSIFM